jgi:glutamate-1-semialdehyde 2,1-aminomutase
MKPRSSIHEGLLSSADEHLPGGSSVLFRLPDDIRFVAREGRGSKLYDVDGREFVDYLLGSGPLILGHAHPAVVEAVQRQVARGSTFYTLNEPLIELAEMVCESAPCAEQVRFASSGSEAILFALRLARAKTGREKILKFEGGYHGVGDYAMYSQAPHGPVEAPVAERESAGVPSVLDSEMLIAPFNDHETAQRMIAQHAGELAAVIFEPLQRCITPRDDFLERTARVAREHDVLVVFDEVVTGYRLAWGGAQEYYRADCDIAVYGKALTGGYAVSAVAGRRDVLELCDSRHSKSDDYAVMSGTLSGNPIGAAAGVATLRELNKPGVFDELHRIGDLLREGLVDAGRRAGVPLQAPGEGPVFQPLIAEHDIVNARAIASSDTAATLRFGYEMVREGILFSAGSKMYVSTAHDENDVDRTVAAADRALQRIKD